jgi:signal peptidase I
VNIKVILKIIEWVVFTFLLILLFLVASPLLPTEKYISTHVISTGSMEPSIETGSVVFSSKNETLNKGDIIVFTSPDDSEKTIVHRIVDIEEDNIYRTKGDNNEDEDRWVVMESQIKGTTILTIPKVGYLIEWIKTPIGFISVLIIPAILFVISQIRKINDGINEEVERRTKIEVNKVLAPFKDTPVPFILLALAISIGFFSTPVAYALFSSNVSIEGITISTAEIYKTPDIVINEIMWSGSNINSKDEWIELKNTTNKEINIGLWKLTNVRGIGQPAINLPGNSKVPPNGYFLIANYPKQAKPTMLNVDIDIVNGSIDLLDTNNGNIVLMDRNNNIVDEVIGSTWPSGQTNKSMQRVSSDVSGLTISNWSTCINILCTSTTYWKIDNGLNYGTPKADNILY